MVPKQVQSTKCCNYFKYSTKRLLEKMPKSLKSMASYFFGSIASMNRQSSTQQSPRQSFYLGLLLQLLLPCVMTQMVNRFVSLVGKSAIRKVSKKWCCRYLPNIASSNLIGVLKSMKAGCPIQKKFCDFVENHSVSCMAFLKML